jgi:bZIP factor
VHPDASDSEAPSLAVFHNIASGRINVTSGHNDIGTPAREVPVPAEISYAVAIYPYMAEQEDEFDVAVYVSRLVPSHGT